MEEKPHPANLAGMFIGARVPFEFVGLIFQAFYSAGINPKSFELAPVYTDARVTAALEEMQGKLNGAVPQITDRSKQPRMKRASPARGGGMKGYLLALINLAPRARLEMQRLLQKQSQWTPKSLDARLHDLTAQKLIHKDADGVYHPTKKGTATLAPKAVETKPKFPRRGRPRQGELSQLDYLLGVLEKAWPQTRTLKKLRAIFKAKGMRPESASVALHVLKAKGQIEMTAPATYKFVQPKQETVDVQPSQP